MFHHFLYIFMKNLISYYHDYASRKESIMHKSVYNDLDIETFFSMLDHTCSYIGKQYLYYLLRQDSQSNIQQFEHIINKFMDDQSWNIKIRNILAKTSNQEAGYICSLFSYPIQTMGQRTINIIGIIRFLPFLFTILTIATHQVIWLYILVPALFIHFYLHYSNKKQIYSYYYAIPQTIRLLNQAELLIKEDLLNSINESLLNQSDLRKMRRHLAMFNISIKLDGEIAILAYTLTELLNIFFLGEYYTINKSLVHLNHKKQMLEDTFRLVGIVDVLYSIARLREQLPYYSIPQHIPSNKYAVMEDIYHPMVKNAVANSIHLQGKSVLIVGSNMCGKTCFIRTIGLNLIAAKVLNTSFSHTFSMNLNTRLFTSIQHVDKLLEGNSLFFQEAIDIKTMLDESSQKECLFLIDEPFSGTNTIERVAICTSVLKSLAHSGNIVCVTTHDIELQNILADEYNCYYFSGKITDKQFLFDYVLHKGKTSERNAISILKLCGYPSRIIQSASEIIKSQNH